MELDVEAEAIRRALRPVLGRRGGGDRVERRVELDGLEALRIEGEPVPSGKPLRIPVLDEARVRPARGADDDGHPLMIRHGEFGDSQGRLGGNGMHGNARYVNPSPRPPNQAGTSLPPAGPAACAERSLVPPYD